MSEQSGVLYGAPPKEIEDWKTWWEIVTVHISEDELRLDDLWEMYQSDDYTAMEAVEYLKLEKGF